MIRNAAKHRARHKLARGVNGDQQPDNRRRRPELFGIEREQRQNEGEAEDVDNDNKKNWEKW